MKGIDARVLVVDDCRMNSLLLRYVLGQEGVPTDTAGTGPEALARASEVGYDVIFMNVVLPELDGVEVARRLEEHALGTRAKIVFMTGAGESFDPGSVGACDVLLKPIAPSSVVSAVRRVVEQPLDVRSAE